MSVVIQMRKKIITVLLVLSLAMTISVHPASDGTDIISITSLNSNL